MSESTKPHWICAYCGDIILETWKTVAGRTGTKCPKCGVMREDEKVFVWVNDIKERQAYWEQIPSGTLLVFGESPL